MTTDINVEWRVLRNGVVQQDLNNAFDNYLVLYSTDSTFSSLENTVRQEAGNSDHILFSNVNAKPTYFIKVKAFRDGNLAAASRAYVFNAPLPIVEVPTTPAPAFLWVLESFGFFTGALGAYQNSTIAGRLAFELIAIFFVIGCIAWALKTWPALRSPRVFLVDKEIAGHKECDRIGPMAKEKGWTASDATELKDLAKKRLSRSCFYGHIGRLERVFRYKRLVKTRNSTNGHFDDVPTVRIFEL